MASAGKIRKAFRWQAQSMVTVSFFRQSDLEQAEAFQLIPLRAIIGTPITCAEKIGTVDRADAARNDPRGFYHGMTVKQGRKTFVLVGPPVVFVAEPARPDGEGCADPEQFKPVLKSVRIISDRRSSRLYIGWSAWRG